MLEDTYQDEEIRCSIGKKTKEHQTLKKDEDQDHMEDSSFLSHKEEEEEENIPFVEEATQKEATRMVVWPYHIVM